MPPFFVSRFPPQHMRKRRAETNKRTAPATAIPAIAGVDNFEDEEPPESLPDAAPLWSVDELPEDPLCDDDDPLCDGEPPDELSIVVEAVEKVMLGVDLEDAAP